MGEAYIIDAVRTPRGIGKQGKGALAAEHPQHLAATVLKAIKDRNNLDTSTVDDVIWSVSTQDGMQAGDMGRMAALDAGYDITSSGTTLDRFCGGGITSVNLAAAQIMSGQSEAAIGGGVESMSRTFMGADSGAWCADPWVAYRNYYAPQGIGADLIASIDGFSREDVDAYAVESQRRAAKAWQEGRFSRSILPITDLLGDVLLDHDEYMRPQTTLEGLAGLNAAFEGLGVKGGFDAVALQRYPQVAAMRHVHTGGNSSGIVDGAAGVLLGSEGFGQRTGIKPRARIKAFASIGSEPTIMLDGPAPCVQKLLKRSGMSLADIDLFEINEAFAAVVLRFMKALELDPSKVNVNGGAIAMGHPLGATGAMILGTVLDELERRDLNTGLVTLCAGNGLATATIIERV